MNSASWIMVACPCVINLSLWWDFTVFPTTVTDSSLALRMTPFVLRHYDAFRSPLLVTCFPQIVILNGGKNALWERRETERWIGVKNLLPWWRLIGFLTTGTDPSHSFRMTFYGLLHHGSEPSSSLRVIPDRPPSERAVAHAARLRILNRHDDSNRKRIFSLQLTAAS